MAAGALLLLAAAPTAVPAADANGNTLLPGPARSDTFLAPDVAFRLAATVESPDRVRLSWAIVPGYYLYQSRLKFSTTSPGMTLGKPELPAGDTKNDEYFGKQVVYHNGLIAHLPVAHAAGASALTLSVTYQGCAEAGLCYPPITKQFDLRLPAGAAAAGGSATGTGGNGGGGAFVSEQDRLARMIRTGSLAGIIATFFGIGLLLAFTPCVLPMVPILSGLIAGQGANVTTQRAFLLSLTYVLGMAVTYTVAGAAFAAAGHQVQAVFQQPWIILLFAALFIALALSMFGLYTLQMPAAIQERLASTSNRQRAGTFGGVAVMGALSALIVTACVAPALVGALLVIGQGGDVVRGAVALFAMSLGMGAPLLVIGTSAGKLLPRAGAWMDTVKQLFGALMLGVAAWMLARLVGDRWSLLLYCVPLAAVFVVLWRVQARGTGGRTLGRAVAVGAAVYAIVLGVGAARGGTDPLHPLAAPALAQAQELPFARVGSVDELDRAVQAAGRSGRAVLLDFYADWCTSCKEMERYTFSDPRVHAALMQLTLLRADVTANNADDQALLKRFGIFGPPTIAFYGQDGVERRNYRVVGYMKADEFAQVVARATSPGG
ncbi:MAG TPA: protein-disulfide reductase DsbD [Steroidobacteraceae bacterium]|nr:protein-disulfide reductase DsbD [Steroidobacteraceae bacterium]